MPIVMALLDLHSFYKVCNLYLRRTSPVASILSHIARRHLLLLSACTKLGARVMCWVSCIEAACPERSGVVLMMFQTKRWLPLGMHELLQVMSNQSAPKPSCLPADRLRG